MPIDRDDPLYPLYRQIIDGRAPRRLILDASKGLLPFEDDVMGDILAVLLQHREDREVLLNVFKTLKNLPQTLVETFAAGRQTDPVLLDAISRIFVDDDQLLRKLVLNRSTPDSSILFVAPRCHANIQALIANNEERLLRTPAIVDRLLENPDIDPDVRRNVLIRQQERLEQARQRGRAVANEDLEVDLEDSLEEQDDDLDEDLDDLDGDLDDEFGEPEYLGTGPAAGAPARGPIPALGEATVTEDLKSIYSRLTKDAADSASGSPDSDLESDEDDQVSEEYEKDVAGRIAAMSQAEKEQLARNGNGTVRGILIKDSSKNVAIAVINSPKLQEDEVAKFARLRSISKDVLRAIGMHREWSKYYEVNLALCKNPLTPLDIAMGKLRMLQLFDLKSLAKSRDVSQNIVNAAKKIVEIKEKRRS